MKKIFSISLILSVSLVFTSQLSAQKLLQSFVEENTSGNTQFGHSVSAAGDVNGDGYDDVIVGAYAYNSSTGRAYIYHGGTSMDNTADLVMNGEGTSNQFGCSVSAAGDVNGDGYDDVIIGAHQYNSDTGRAYIYHGGTSMDNTADLIMTGEGSISFGYSVSAAGDVNGDGYDDVIVCAYRYNFNTGRAYIYHGGTSMDNTADLLMNGEGTWNNFGFSVSATGDVNGDGYDDVIVGAYWYNSNTGRAYIYHGGTSMDNTADLVMTGEGTGNQFGYSVSAAGDVNGDGYADVIVGAHGYNSLTGRAYIYHGGTSMDNTADLQMNGEGTSNNFGYSVSSAGDVDGDGYADVIVGARGYNSYTGRAYIFHGGTSMDNTADLVMNGEGTNNYFGTLVFSAGDVNGDGYNDVIVGAYRYNSNTGRAYIYHGGTSMDNTADLVMTGEGTSNYFGCSVSSAGDVNGDGYDDVIVGANNYNSATGRAYIYHGGTSMDNTADLVMNGEGTNNSFGISVSAAGDVNGDGYADVIVGAGAYNTYTGRAYIYHGGTSMDNTADLVMNGEETNNFFGSSVSAAGDVNGDGYDDVIVGARGYNSYTGRAYIYHGGTSMDNTADLIMNGEGANNYFGSSVSEAGDVNSDGYTDVLVGAYGYNSATGRVYIYYGGLSMDNTADLLLTGEGTNNWFGVSASSAGDVNGDGYSDVVVGAEYYNMTAGRSYIYYGSEIMDNSVDIVMDPDGINSHFGKYVSQAGDINSDGYDDIIIGAYYYNYGTGRAYIYHGGASMDNTADQVITGEGTSNSFGYSISAAGDVNGDGYADVIVGAYGYPVNGKAYIFSFSPWPELETNSIVDIAAESATANGFITDLGDTDPTAHGFCWNTSGDPTLSDSYTDLGGRSSTGTFSDEIIGLNPNTTYYIKAYATNDDGAAYGEELNFTTLKQDQTITFSALADLSYGDIDFDLTATASSGLTVSYSSSDESVATVDGSTLTIVAAGTTTITASQAGDDTYNPADDADQILTINKATLTVSAEDKSKTYGDANPLFTYSYDGFVNSEDATVLTTEPTASSLADETSPAGDEDITVSGGVADNYSFNYVDGTLTIDEAVLIATADDKSKTYGDVNPVFTFSYDGFVNSEDAIVLTTEPTASSLADETSPAGDEDITVSGGIADNYSFSYLDGTLTIDEAILIATADDKSKTYGDVNPAFTVSYSGFVNSEDATVLTTEPTASSLADETSPAGDEDITVSGGVADNYSFSYVDGTLTINKATLTVTADDKSKTYGDENPVFTFSYDGFVNDDDTEDIDLLPIASCEADENSVPGEYDIVVSSGNDNNYELNYINGVLTVDQTTGLELNQEQEFLIKVYPNPAKLNLYIDLSGTYVLEVAICDVTGKILYLLDHYQVNTPINIEALKPGLYFARICLDNTCYIKKFIKD